MELSYTNYVAGMGTRQPIEHYFYSPNLDFAIILHKPIFMKDVLFPRFVYGESSRIRADYNGEVKKVNVSDEVVQTLYERGRQFHELRSSLDAVIQQLMQSK